MSGKSTTTNLAGAAAREHRGENAHHAALFEHVFERVHMYFRRLVRDPNEVEECAQRTLVELERSLRDARYDPARSFNVWIWLKAHSVFVGWCRERARRPAALSDETAGPPPAPVGEQLDAETILRELERRAGREAYECFILRFESGLTLEEVAAAVERDRKTVAARLRAAREVIDRLLGERGAPP